MKQTRTTSRTIDRLLRHDVVDEVVGEQRRSMASLAVASPIPSTILTGTGLSMAADRVATELRTTCVHVRSTVEGHWLYTPKFGKFDHSQRWRCTT